MGIIDKCGVRGDATLCVGIFYMTSQLKCVNLTLRQYLPTLCGASIALFYNKDSTYVTYRRKQIGVQCKRRLEFLKVVDVIQDF